jgi:hypothetical protein
MKKETNKKKKVLIPKVEWDDLELVGLPASQIWMPLLAIGADWSVSL